MAVKETAAEYDQRHQQILDSRPTTTRCLYCTWTYEGTAVEGRLEAQEHRTLEHPERAAYRYAKRRRKYNTTNITVQQEETMTAERLRRMRLLGINS